MARQKSGKRGIPGRDGLSYWATRSSKGLRRHNKRNLMVIMGRKGGGKINGADDEVRREEKMEQASENWG